MTVLSTEQALALALEQHTRGRLAEAESIYRQILQRYPDHPGALHLLGVVIHQSGDHAAGAELIERAIALRPDEAQYYGNLGEVLRAMGRTDEAAAAFRRAIALRGDFAEAYSNLGNIHRQRKQFDEAVAHYRRALALKGDFLQAGINLGNTLAEMGRIDEAVDLLRRITLLAPNSATAFNDLGSGLTQQHKYEEAVDAYRRAIELNPNFADAYCNVSNALTELGRNDDAVACSRRAVELNPKLSIAYCNMANALTNLERFDEAVAACGKAIALKDDYPEAYNNLGVALQKQDHLEEAMAAYRRVLAMKPDFARAMNNLGEALKNVGRVGEGIAACGRAVEIEPEYAEAHWNHSLCLLLSGQLERGFADYEWRLRWNLFPAINPPFAQPQWDGSELDGRTILVHSEQGLGDTLQFIRYVPLVAARGGKVVVQCPRSLAPLIASVRGIHRLVPYGDPLGEFDVQSHLMSLPHVMGTTLANIPADVPYVSPDGELVDAWKQRLEPRDGLRVGLAWAGSRLNKNDRHRSIPLDRLAPLAQAPGVTFYSLQMGDGAEQAANPAGGMKLIDLTSQIGDFADTAALIANLDLVICVDTAVAHLAGAMGKPVWTLLPFAPDWRWLLEREDSPWYPTMRLFRQSQRSQWEPVIARVAGELKSFSPARPRRG